MRSLTCCLLAACFVGPAAGDVARIEHGPLLLAAELHQVQRVERKGFGKARPIQPGPSRFNAPRRFIPRKAFGRAQPLQAQPQVNSKAIPKPPQPIPSKNRFGSATWNQVLPLQPGTVRFGSTPIREPANSNKRR
jgi:hypothetical protein